MGKFEKALEGFKKNGCFALKNSTLNFSELSCLQSLVQNLTLLSYRPVLGYQIILRDIKLLPFFYTKEDLTPPPLFGAVTSAEYSGVARGDKQVDLSLIYFSRKNSIPFILGLGELENKPDIPFQKFEKKLLDLFIGYGFWSSIEIKNIYFYHPDHYQYLSDFFHHQLLDIIVNQTYSLKELKIAPIATLKKSAYVSTIRRNDSTENQSLFENMGYVNKFMYFLKFNTQLSILHIESYSDITLFIQELSELLKNHTQINHLELAGRPLKQDDYQSLINLSYENYRIKTLKIVEPADNLSLRALHEKLILRFSIHPKKRFKQDWVNPRKLTGLAIEAIKDNKITLLKILTRNKESKKITSLIYINNIFNSLPSVYKQHKEYFTHYINDFSVNLNEKLDLEADQITIRCYLIMTAISFRKFEVMLMIIEKFKLGFTECFHKYSDISKQLLSSLAKNHPSSQEWKNQLLIYLTEKNDLPSLFPGFINLKFYPNIYLGLVSIKNHLDNYLQKLIMHSQWPSLLRLMTDISFLFENYQIEWAQTFHVLAELSADLEKNQKILDSEQVIEKIIHAMQQITNITEHAQHGWLSHSTFNKTLQSLSQTIITESVNYKQNYIDEICSNPTLYDSFDNEKTKQEINAASINSITYKTKETHLNRFYQANQITPDQAHWIELQELQIATTSFNLKS